MHKKKSIGIIGIKGHAKKMTEIVESDSVEIIHYHPEDRHDEVQKLFGTAAIFTSVIDDLSACDEILILSPNATHFKYLQKLLNQTGFTGKVWLEKPPVASSDEAMQLLSFPDSFKSRVYINFNYRYSRTANLLLELTSKYGKPLSLYISHSHGLAFKNEFKKSWRMNARAAILETVGIHYIDLVDYCLTQIQSIKTVISSNSNLGNDTTHSILNLVGGGIGFLFCSYAAPCERFLQITFSEAIARFDLEGLSVWYPRDTFSSGGTYLPPPLELHVKYEIEFDIKRSVQAAYIDFSKSKSFDPHDFDRKVILTSMALSSLE
jgi:predicted dehydrogenase